MTSEKILEILFGLHQWREGYNKDNIGFGADEIFNNESDLRHYPHAYAIWGTGYVNLYKITHDDFFLRKAKSCAQWLITNKSPRYEEFSWGLPLDRKGADPNLSFSVTSLYCANLFDSLFELKQESEYADILNSIRGWILHKNGYVLDLDQTRGIWIKYANHPKWPASIYNATAMSAGFFAKLYARGIGDKKENAYFAASCARYILGKQHPQGFWHYGDVFAKIDLIHSALVLEGIVTFVHYSGFFKPEIFAYIQKNIDFLDGNNNKIMQKNGYALENYPSVFLDPFDIKGYRQVILFIYNKLFKKEALETRSYGYGMAVKALSLCTSINDRAQRICDNLINYLCAQHLKCDGSFRFRGDVPHSYIRMIGHIFEGLSAYLLIPQIGQDGEN